MVRCELIHREREEKESRESQEKKRAMVSRGMTWAFILVQSLLVIATYLVWKCSSSKLIAIIIISSVTPMPGFMLMFTLNVFCFVAIQLRKMYPSTFSDGFHRVVKFLGALLMALYWKILHGYEIHGKENLPRTTGGLVVYHHALQPCDVMYLLCEQNLTSQIPFGGIVNRQMVGFIKPLCESFGIYCERDSLVSCLKKGHHCAVAPGGGIEGTFSKDYELIWNGRVGFAEVAKECGVPVIPMFTANSQQAMPITTFGFYDYFLDLYRRTKKYPYFFVFCFPAKLRTYLGTPLFCGANETPAEFAERVKAAIYDLRDKHQRQPGNFILAILERFGYQATGDGSNPAKNCDFLASGLERRFLQMFSSLRAKYK